MSNNSKRVISQIDLNKAGFVHHPDDYDSSKSNSNLYDLWVEIWEKRSLRNDEIIYHYCHTRHFMNGEWHYQSESLELVIQAEFIPLELSLYSVRNIESILLKPKEGF